MRILMLTRYDRMGASSRLRSYQYAPYLARNGIQVTVAPLFSSAYLQKRNDHQRGRVFPAARAYMERLRRLFSVSYDLIWLEKEVFPWLPDAFEKIGAVGRTPLVVDYDDAIFHKYDLSPFKMVRRLLGKKIDRIMRRAELVIAGNAYLAERARRAGATRIEILPTVVDMERYGAPEERFVDADRRIIIGWIGSPTTAPYFHSLDPVFRRLSRRFPVKVVNVGGGNIRMADVSLDNLKWREDTEVQHIKTFDIGVMPLPDSPWARGKCGYKLIQYMACAKPVVASAVGANLDIVEEGKNGFLAASCEDFYGPFVKLIKDRPLRYRLGQAGLKMVKKEYSLQKTAPELLALLKSVVRN